MAYTPPGVTTFDGSTNWLERGSDLAGNADTKLGIFSVWFRTDVDSTTTQFIRDDSAFVNFERDGVGNNVRIRLHTSAATKILDMTSSAVLAAGWHHLLAAWDLGNTTAHLYIDDVSDATTATLIDGTIDYTRTTWHIGAALDNTFLWDGAFAQFYLTNEYLDLSVDANRRKFITAGLEAADLGSDGSKPTGTSPLIYMKDGPPIENVNAGTGGDFVSNGTFTFTAGDPPESSATISRGHRKRHGKRSNR